MSIDIRPYVSRNGVRFMNLAFFNPSVEKLLKVAQAQKLMEEIYFVPIDSQTLVADLLAKENEELVPYMFYEAIRTGHAAIAKAVKDSGQMNLRDAGPGGWDDCVSQYRRKRTEEVFSLAKHKEIVDGVKKWLDEFDNDVDHLMYFAADAGHKHIVCHLLEISIARSPSTKLSPISLHTACFKGHLDCAKMLVESGSDINSKDEYGGTPLMRAAAAGDAEVVRWLLANGADPQIRETREGNCNALELAAGRSVEVMEMLLGGTTWSPTALMAAASFGNLESFNILVQKGGFPDPGRSLVDRNFWQETLSEQHREAILGSIDQGGSNGNLAILNFLLCFIPSEIMSGEDVTKVLKESVKRAACANHDEATKLLLNILNDNRLEDDGFNLFVSDLVIDTAVNNAIEATRLLLDSFGADINFLDSAEKMSPLHHAVIKDRPEMVELLVKEYNADIHRGGGKYSNGPSPLWYAIEHQLERPARVLLAYGGPVDSIDSSIKEGQETKRIFISADRTYRAPVRLRKEMDPAWDDDDCTERFLCLEYPDGWPGGIQLRRSDDELKDERELRKVEDSGFVII